MKQTHTMLCLNWTIWNISFLNCHLYHLVVLSSRCWFLLLSGRFVCRTTVPSQCLSEFSWLEGTALTKCHSHTSLSRRRWDFKHFWHLEATFTYLYESFVADPAGWRLLSRLGFGLHAHFEQFAASRENIDEEIPESGGVWNPSFSLCPLAASSPALHLSPKLMLERRRKAGNQTGKDQQRAMKITVFVKIWEC